MIDRRHLMTLLAATAALPLARSAERERTVPAHTMRPAAEKLQVAALFYENAILFDYGGPVDIFRAAEWTNAFHVWSVAPTPGAIRNAFFPRELHPDFTFENCPRPNVVIVPGGDWVGVEAAFKRGDRRIARFLERTLSDGGTLLGVCTGAYILALSGLLDGRRATSLPYEIATFRRLAPRTVVREDMVFVDDGNIVTASGGFGGIEAALHLVRRMRGLDTAKFVAYEYLNYDAWDPEFTGKVM